jgi:glutamate dehydrogenase
MEQQQQDLRTQTLDLVIAATAASAMQDKPQVTALIRTWLASLDDDDLSEITPASLASGLWDGFSQAAKRTVDGCQVSAQRYADGRGGFATALLILNADVPYLVDSLVMAIRKRRVGLSAVLNAVLSVHRSADGSVTHADMAATKSGPLESYVLCLLSDELTATELEALVANICMVAGDAAVVQRDAAALATKITSVAADAASLHGAEGQEVAAFLDWAKNGGFEIFGYGYFSAIPGARELVRDLPSRMGVLQMLDHPVYGGCLANIPGDFETLAARSDILSVVKADVQGTLHRDQRLDFIGVRDTDTKGVILGEHCFVGLFTRASTSTTVAQLPIARLRVVEVLRLAGVRQEGFRAEKFLEILDSLPRTEIMEADLDWLAQVCSSVVSLYKQPRTKVFARRDVYARHLNVLVYMPRERFSASLLESMSQALRASTGASDVRSQTLVADGPLARIYMIANAARYPLDLETDIQQPLLTVLDGWLNGFEKLADSLPDPVLRGNLRRLSASLPVDYLAATSPPVAARDLMTLLMNDTAPLVKVRIETATASSGEAATIRLYSTGQVPPLSRILPALYSAGVLIDREKTYTLASLDGTSSFVTSLKIDAASAAHLAKPEVCEVAEELFEALFNNKAEDGRLNGLVVTGGLRAREVQMVRAYMSYWRQTGSRFSVRYIADCLRQQPARVKVLVGAFLQRFNPELPLAQREEGTAALHAIKADLAAINHADTELIVGCFVDLMLATLRTNYFQNKQQGDTIIFKFDSSGLPWLPEPRPYREIFVFSRRFEGVHLRGGPVARGGLRWSDRMEDYRTEVMGLVKAQMVKNAVIVPAGAKGGFVCKMMPKNALREVIAAEGEAVYRLFIGGLLDVTDNRVRGEIIAPMATVCYDDQDPYLVVAADKGTATFSDIANGIAVKRGFWLGDAFASGGSNGYDHKKLGITAKGAWEAVKRHFYEMGHDMNTMPFTMVGIGDMSGDVFGNGVLLSRQLKVVAAFDHRHVFIDPNPDVAVSFDERVRMFALPRSSWEDYNKELISGGGGVWPRSARSIPLSAEAKAVLGIAENSLPPEELLHRILLAPVDLFYNGGIGTYIKSASESHEQVKDRANDNIRVNGGQLRCKVVAEGGNLGATQAGRIEFALAGGRIFTDAIDNSAGVDCSDHEVNAKIWLDVEVNAGKINEAERNRVLNEMTDDIEVLVLRDNTLQTHLLTREMQAQSEAAVQDGYAALICSLEDEGALSRELEQLPSVLELAKRKDEGRCLTTPELAVVVAHVKNRFKRILSEVPLTEASWAETILKPYFPQGLVATRAALDHPLANAILATVLANEAVNRCGPLMIGDLARSHHVEESKVVAAWAQAWSALNLGPIFDALDASALTVPCAVSIEVDARTRVLQKAIIEAVLSVPAEHLQGSDGMAQLAQLFSQTTMVQSLIPTADAAEQAATKALPTDFVAAWHAVDAIESVAAFLFASLSVARPTGMDLAQFLQVGMTLRAQAGIARLERGLKRVPGSHLQCQLRDYAQQALRRAQQRLLADVMGRMTDGQTDHTGAVTLVVQGLGMDDHAANAAQQAHGHDAGLEPVMLEVWALSEAAATAAA